MKTSKKGRSFISLCEGVALKPYKCPAGYWTVGVGHRMTPHECELWGNLPITAHQADALLSGDLYIAERCIVEAVKVPLHQSKFDALVSLIFNIGVSNFKKSTLLKKLNNGEDVDAEFLKWVKVKGDTLNGLMLRRQREVQIFHYDTTTNQEARLQVSRFYY